MRARVRACVRSWLHIHLPPRQTGVNLGGADSYSKTQIFIYMGWSLRADCTGKHVDHAVLLVGAGTTGSLDYWIVK